MGNDNHAADIEQWRKINEHGGRISRAEKDQAVTKHRVSALEEAMARSFGEISKLNAKTDERFGRVEDQIAELGRQVTTIVTTAATAAKAVKLAAWFISAGIAGGSLIVGAVKAAQILGWV